MANLTSKNLLIIDDEEELLEEGALDKIIKMVERHFPGQADETGNE